MIGDGGEYSYILRDSSYKQLIWKESNQAKRAYVNIPPPDYWRSGIPHNDLTRI